MSSKDQPEKGVDGAPTSAEKTKPLDDVLRVLKKNSAISAWLNSEEDGNPDVFIILANELSDAERNALTETADVVLRAHDNVAKKLAELERQNRYLESLSLTDALTGLYNYRFFVKQLEVEMGRTNRTGQPCSLMMIDLDDFKLLNDTLGHDEGNKYLVKVGHILREKMRPTDILCRYAGDEFAIIMPATVLFDALRIGERLRQTLSEIPCKLDRPFSASIGLAEYDPASAREVSEFVNTADKALYRAKKRGKNKICYEGKLPEIVKVEPVTQEEKDALLKQDVKKTR
jgi:diguanylate cyclase (GGDEF)-like protein